MAELPHCENSLLKKKVRRTILRRLGASITKIALIVQRMGVVDPPPLDITEVKALLNSSFLDCRELNS